MLVECKEAEKIVQRVHYSGTGVMEDHAATVAFIKSSRSNGHPQSQAFLFLFSSMLIRGFWEVKASNILTVKDRKKKVFAMKHVRSP